MHHRLKPFLGENDIPFKSQYGLREKHSTQHAIIDIVNVIQNNMDQKRFTCAIFFLKRPLIPSTLILLQKINPYGIRGIINDWFASYCLDCSQVTKVGSNLSTECMTSCGVPQGSVLGPLSILDLY